MKELARALLASKEQLLNLKHDLENNLIPENNTNDFVVNEIKSAEKIDSSIRNILDRNKDAVSKIEAMHIKMTSPLDSNNE